MKSTEHFWLFKVHLKWKKLFLGCIQHYSMPTGTKNKEKYTIRPLAIIAALSNIYSNAIFQSALVTKYKRSYYMFWEKNMFLEYSWVFPSECTIEDLISLIISSSHVILIHWITKSNKTSRLGYWKYAWCFWLFVRELSLVAKKKNQRVSEN